MNDKIIIWNDNTVTYQTKAGFTNTTKPFPNKELAKQFADKIKTNDN